MTTEELSKAKSQALILGTIEQVIPKPRPPRSRGMHRVLPVGVYLSRSGANPYRTMIKRGGKVLNGGSYSTIGEAVDAVAGLRVWMDKCDKVAMETKLTCRGYDVE